MPLVVYIVRIVSGKTRYANAISYWAPSTLILLCAGAIALQTRKPKQVFSNPSIHVYALSLPASHMGFCCHRRHPRRAFSDRGGESARVWEEEEEEYPVILPEEAKSGQGH